MFSPGVDGGEFKSMRLAGEVSADPLTVDGPGALFSTVGGERWGAEALSLDVEGERWAAAVLSPVEVTPWAEVWEDDAASVWAKPELPPALSGLFLLLLLLRLWPLLG